MHFRTVTMANAIDTAKYLGLVDPELHLWFLEEVFKNTDGPNPSVVIDLDTWQRRVDNMAEMLRESWQKAALEWIDQTKEQWGVGTVPADSGDAAEAGGEDGAIGGGALEPVPEARERA